MALYGSWSTKEKNYSARCWTLTSRVISVTIMKSDIRTCWSGKSASGRRLSSNPKNLPRLYFLLYIQSMGARDSGKAGNLGVAETNRKSGIDRMQFYSCLRSDLSLVIRRLLALAPNSHILEYPSSNSVYIYIIATTTLRPYNYL